MRISDWSSDVCSSDRLIARHDQQQRVGVGLCDRKRDRGGGVARYRLDEQRFLTVAHLLAHHRDMAVTAQDDGRQEIGAGGVRSTVWRNRLCWPWSSRNCLARVDWQRVV